MMKIMHANPEKRRSSRSRKKHRRVVEKNGDPNIQYKNISHKRRKYLDDIYTTLIDSSWMQSLLLFAASFYISWLLFAIIYYVISYVHGDFDSANGYPSNMEGRALVRTGAMVAAAPVNFGQRVHAPIDFQILYI